MCTESSVFMKHLKDKLKNYFGDNEVNILSFEQNAGLKRNVIYNVLSDKSKNPTIDTVIKIADALNCSIDGLFAREEYFKNYLKEKRSVISYDSKLFENITKFINQFIYDQKIKTPSLGDIFYLVEEIYQYSLSTNKGVLDEKFALWFLKNQFEK